MTNFSYVMHCPHKNKMWANFLFQSCLFTCEIYTYSCSKNKEDYFKSESGQNFKF